MIKNNTPASDAGTTGHILKAYFLIIVFPQRIQVGEVLNVIEIIIRKAFILPLR